MPKTNMQLKLKKPHMKTYNVELTNDEIGALMCCLQTAKPVMEEAAKEARQHAENSINAEDKDFWNKHVLTLTRRIVSNAELLTKLRTI